MRRRHGFTLIELTTVVMIITVLLYLTGLAISRRYRQRSGTSISDGPSRSRASRMADSSASGLVARTARNIKRGGVFEEVGIVELDVEVTAVVIAILDVLDRAIGGSRCGRWRSAQPVSGDGGELLRCHEEAAIPADDDYWTPARARPLHRGQPERPSPT